MKRPLFVIVALSLLLGTTGCDLLQTPAESVRPRPLTDLENETTSTSPVTPVTPSSSAVVTTTPVNSPALSTVDTSSWQRFEFKELGFSIELPFAAKDITLSYKETKANEQATVSATNPLMYSYQGFLKGQAGLYTFLGSTSENYTSDKAWELTDAQKLSMNGESYQIGMVSIHPLAHIPVGSNLLIAFDATKDYYQPVKSPASMDQWYGAVFALPNNKRFKVAVLQFKTQDLSLDQLIAALKTVKFSSTQFTLNQVSAPSSTPRASTAPQHNPNNAPYILNRSNNPVVCGTSPSGGQSTKWVYSCSDRRTTYNTNETVYGLFRIDSIFKNFRFKTEVYKDGLFQWEDLGVWNTVDQPSGWARSYATPVLSNVSAGNWEIRYYVDTGDGFSTTPLATSNFSVYGTAPTPSNPTPPSTPQSHSQPFMYDNNGSMCGSQPSGGSWSQWWYTCSSAQTAFTRGQTAYGLIHISNVFVPHYFTMEVYKDGVYQRTENSSFNNVDQVNGWNYAFFLPVFANLDPGNWSVNISVQYNGIKQFLKTLTFQVTDNSISNCTQESYFTNHGENAQIGTKFCSNTLFQGSNQYTIVNVLNSNGCYPVSSGQTITIGSYAGGDIEINNQPALSYNSSVATYVLVVGCNGGSAPVKTFSKGPSITEIYQATAPFRVIIGQH